MPNFKGLQTRIIWGDTLQYALDIAYPLDSAVSGDDMRAGSEVVQGASGVEDSWITGWDAHLEGVVRWIPRDATLTPRGAGWDSVEGWRLFLRWARAKNTLWFFPDGRNLIVSPKMNVDTNTDGTVDDFVNLAAGGEVGASRALDGTELAQRFILPTGNAGKFYGVSQNILNIMPGEVLSYSVDVKCASITANGVAKMYMEFRDSVGALIAGTNVSTTTASTTYTRLTIANRLAPALTASAHLQMYSSTPGAGDAVTSFWKNAQFERAAAYSGSFIDNPKYPSYLVEPAVGYGDLEDDFTRKLNLKLRTADGQAWSGY